MTNDKIVIVIVISHRGLRGEAQLGQCLAGSFSGAELSQKVTERPIKVGLARMEIGLDV